MKLSVILLAGGIGKRLGGTTPKQYLLFKDRIVARHSFDIFLHHPAVKEIIVVAEEKYHHHFHCTEMDQRITFANPGPLRQDSVFNGLQKVSETAEFVAVHDSARPMIDKKMIDRVLKGAETAEAATVAVPIKFTVKIADSDGFVKETPDRSKVWEIQTPQIIKRELLIKASLNSKTNQLFVTDDVSLVENLGKPVKLVMGSYKNIKITTPEDLIILRSLIP